ncbi:DNA/RNA non-specific endonuclease [bacterium]|nr:DNA/RNA non-specific endonuclease [bacterium]
MRYLNLIFFLFATLSIAFSQDNRFTPSLPSEIIHRTGYSISWNEELRMPFMISYELTPDDLKRSDCLGANYRKDPDFTSYGEVDYRGVAALGYEKGHLLPRMHSSWSDEACEHASYYSNITLQSRDINRGLWRECDNRVDQLVELKGRAYVHTGPLPFYYDTLPSGIPLPIGFWKVVLYEDGLDWRKEIYLVAQLEKEDSTISQIECANETALELFLGHDVFNHNLIEPIPSVQKVDSIARIDSKANLPKWPYLEGEFTVKRVLREADLSIPDTYHYAGRPSSFIEALRITSIWTSKMGSLETRSNGLLATGAIMGRMAFRWDDSRSKAIENFGLGRRAILAFTMAAESFANLSEAENDPEAINEFRESSGSCYEKAAKVHLFFKECEDASELAEKALQLNPHLDDCRQIINGCN